MKLDISRFDALYAKERKERNEREQSRRERYKKQNKQELKDVERINAESIRNVLLKRLKGKRIDDHYQRRDDESSYRSDKTDRRGNSERRIYDDKGHSDQQLQGMKKEGKKRSSFRAKLHELSMTPRTRKKKELESLRSESTQQPSSGKFKISENKANLRNLNKAASRRGEPSSSERSKTSRAPIKGSPGSWLFKSAKERKKELLQQQLDLRRQIRSQAVSPERQKLTRSRKIAANRLLSSPKKICYLNRNELKEFNRDKFSLLFPEPVSILSCQQINKSKGSLLTARSDDISTTQTRSSLKQVLKNRKGHQTARNVVEEDLKQRLQQMDFKLTPTKIPKSRKSKRSGTSNSRSSNSVTLTNNNNASLRSSKRQRIRHRKSEKQSYGNKSKYFDESSHRLSRKHQKMSGDSKSSHSKLRKHVSNKSAISDRNAIAADSQKKLVEKSSESEEEDLESDTTQGISMQNKLKGKKMINNGGYGRRRKKKEQWIKMDGLKKIRNKKQKNLTMVLNHQPKLKKKIRNDKEVFLKPENMAKEQLRRQRKSMSKTPSNNRKAKRISRKRSNQQSAKIILSSPPSSSFVSSSTAGKKSKQTQLGDRNSMNNDRKNIKATKSGMNRISRKSRNHSNFTNNSSAKAIISQNILSNHSSTRRNTSSAKVSRRKLNSSSFPRNIQTVDGNLFDKSPTNQKTAKKFMTKLKKGKMKKANRENSKKTKSLEANLKLNSHTSHDKDNSYDSSKSLKSTIKLGRRKDNEKSIATVSSSGSSNGNKKMQIRQCFGSKTKDQTSDRSDEREI
uniref:Uncharacterized protein n=1 Tax=Elaeophora elaphi TaxID=1147741 RepID=A0A0R3RIL6_9BILA